MNGILRISKGILALKASPIIPQPAFEIINLKQHKNSEIPNNHLVFEIHWAGQIVHLRILEKHSYDYPK